MQIQNKLDNLTNRLNNLRDSNNKIILECINDKDSDSYYHLIKVLNRFNEVIDKSDAIGIPKDYIDTYIKKYNCKVGLEFFIIDNGNKTPTIPLIHTYNYN